MFVIPAHSFSTPPISKAHFGSNTDNSGEPDFQQALRLLSHGAPLTIPTDLAEIKALLGHPLLKQGADLQSYFIAAKAFPVILRELQNRKPSQEECQKIMAFMARSPKLIHIIDEMAALLPLMIRYAETDIPSLYTRTSLPLDQAIRVAWEGSKELRDVCAAAAQEHIQELSAILERIEAAEASRTTATQGLQRLSAGTGAGEEEKRAVFDTWAQSQRAVHALPAPAFIKANIGVLQEFLEQGALGKVLLANFPLLSTVPKHGQETAQHA